jgi:ribosomal protein S18 acetylase RimI-like enzyme
MTHFLDNPVWHALGGPQAGLGREAGGFRFYRGDVAHFVGTAEPLGRLDGLAALVAPGSFVSFVTAGNIDVPAGFETLFVGEVLQMVAERFVAIPSEVRLERLDDRHVPAMMELVELTKPGPFAERTIEMGGYLGVFDGARLVAMSGERMRLEGFAEVSAVCTHPDYRGRGYASALVSAVGAGIVARGETPFLNVYPDNQAAIRTYERLGFAGRRLMRFTRIQRAG